MIRRLRPRSAYDVLATLAFVGVIAGGTAYAADTVFSTDIKDGEVKTADLANAAVTNGKLAGDARSRAFSYVGTANDAPDARHVVVSLGGLRVAVRCSSFEFEPNVRTMLLYAKNTANTPAQANGGWARQVLTGSSTQDDLETAIDGFPLSPGEERTLDSVAFNAPDNGIVGVASNQQMRAEGQITFHRDGSNEVTTVVFHAYLAGVSLGNRCEFQGTADHAVP